MRAVTLQIPSDGFFSSIIDDIIRAASLILGDDFVRPILLIIAAMLVVGAWIFAARFLIGRRVAQFEAEWAAKEAERKAEEEREGPKG